MFGLLAADSIFVAATAVLIVVLGTGELGNYSVSLLASLLYLVNFSVPNLRLTGLVDAGEGFFLLAILWSLSDSSFWRLPLIAALGSSTKESFIPFSIALTGMVDSRTQEVGFACDECGLDSFQLVREPSDDRGAPLVDCRPPGESN